jgi:hypothetical protein
MKNFRVRYHQEGGHVHVRVFSAKARHKTHAKLGDLCYDADEWFVGCLKAHGDVSFGVVE